MIDEKRRERKRGHVEKARLHEKMEMKTTGKIGFEIFVLKQEWTCSKTTICFVCKVRWREYCKRPWNIEFRTSKTDLPNTPNKATYRIYDYNVSVKNSNAEYSKDLPWLVAS